MSSSPVRFGVVGVGRITREQFAPALVNTECAVLQTAASRDIRRAKALNPQRAYDSYSKLLHDPDVDAVYVGTHNGLHKELVIEALEHGKHVLCEKPLGCTAAECEEMVAAADSAERYLVEAFMYRHHPQVRRAQKLLQDGVVGELVAVEASFSVHLRQTDDVRLHAAWGGGSLLDVGCYCVNFARLFLGDSLQNVSAWAKIDRTHGVDMAVHGALEYESGKHAAVSCGFEGGLYQRAVLIGTDGVIDLNAPFVTWLRRPRLAVQTDNGEDVIEFEPVNTFEREIEDLCAAILGGTPPLLNSNEGLLNARVLDRLMAAAVAGDTAGRSELDSAEAE
ncbi:MAG: Gfo/Idh/MocA family oxidoreductase [Gemmatimonadota bacterium]|nr:MAG: Gfo/Idh/MocA family oxidoreductase [Gemmatimonadota bacterium]